MPKVLPPEVVTRQLRAWQDGDHDALADLFPILLEDLRRLARFYLAQESVGHTLQPTALVNEVYLRLAGSRIVSLSDRGSFFGFASRLMRDVLVDHARARRSLKRGGDLVRTPLDEALDLPVRRGVDLMAVLAIDAALQRLESLDPRQARIVQLRYFSGLTIDEVASVLEVSVATVKRDWQVARLWMAREIGDSSLLAEPS